METRASYVVVGAFVLAMAVLALAAVLWLARGALTTQYAHYYIYFEGPVTGLRNGSEVDYNGVPVGRVIGVRIDPQNVGQVQVTAEIGADVPIKTDARASLQTNILSGVSYILVDGGTQSAALLRPTRGEVYAVIPSRRSPLAQVTASGPQLLHKLDDTVVELNQLLDARNRQTIADTLNNLDTFSRGLAARNQDIAEFTANANASARGLAALIADVDRSYTGANGLDHRLTTAIADLDRLARNLNDSNRQLQQALQDVRPGLRNFSQQTLGDIGSLVAETRQAVAGLNRVTDQIGRDPSQVLFGDRREGYRPQ
jgi:phospholipid/cholesterol/gamma-HCH transport system substrate-binding protein